MKSTSLGLAVVALMLTLVAGCSSLGPTKRVQTTFYALNDATSEAAAKPPVAAAAQAPTLIINPPHASAGFDSRRIRYVRELHHLEYFAHSEWVDTPARMLAPLLASALERSGAFRAVLLTPSAATAELRLDTEILRLQHDFLSQPSRVRFTLRAHLVDHRTRQVIAWREFDQTEDAASADPYAGVVAAHRAVEAVLEQLAAFCAEAARVAGAAGAAGPRPAPG